MVPIIIIPHSIPHIIRKLEPIDDAVAPVRQKLDGATGGSENRHGWRKGQISSEAR